MLAAGAAERDHEVFESAALIAADACVHKRQDVGKILVHALLLLEIVDDWLVLAGHRAEALFASGVGKAAGVEYKSAAVAGFVGGHFMVEGEAEDTDL